VELPSLNAQASSLEVVEADLNAALLAAQQRSAQRRELVERVRRLGAAAPFVTELESVISKLAAERAAGAGEPAVLSGRAGGYRSVARATARLP
jgi:hypothetical protein